MRRVLTYCFLAWLLIGICRDTSTAGESGSEIPWREDYAAAMASAQRQATMMVVYFQHPESPLCRKFESAMLDDPLVLDKLRHAVCVRLPLDASIRSGGEPVVLLDHQAFAGLDGHGGIAILDFATARPERKGQVVRTVALAEDRAYRRGDFDILPAPPPVFVPACNVAWLDDYERACRVARQQEKMLLIHFHCPDGGKGCRLFDGQTMADARVCAALASYVMLQVHIDYEVSIDGRKAVLLKEPSFAEMVGLPGVAVVDYSDRAADYYGQVVSTFPFLKGRAYNPAEMLEILNLPPGTLTQRTLIYAVRTHPDSPASTEGDLDDNLIHEAQRHSGYQASIRLQGHHRWETRFHRLNRKLPSGLLACEVCAESWPGEGLLEAAIECVRCWRFSSGHWSAVREHHPRFGYDMKRGSNGIWYATGVFGRRR